MQAAATFSFAGLVLGLSACATLPAPPRASVGVRIKVVRAPAAGVVGNLTRPKVWDYMGQPDQPKIITDSDPPPPLPAPRRAVSTLLAPAGDDANCRRAAVVAERRHRLPHGLLSAIAYTESSMIPTALRVDGHSLYPKTRTEAERIADDALSRKSTVMAGCMQVNLQVHDPNGASWALDPVTSSNWAAEYLWELYDRLGSWASAISAYGGSRTSSAYLYRVIGNLQTVENDPTYIQLASYQPTAPAVAHADCRYLTDGGQSWPGTARDGRAPLYCGGAGAGAHAEAAEAAAFPQFARLVAAIKTGCWNLPDWLNGRAGACNTASSEKMQMAGSNTGDDSTVRLGMPAAPARPAPVLRRAMVRVAEPEGPASPSTPRRAAKLPKPPVPPSGDGFGTGWPHLAISPNRSGSRRKPRLAGSASPPGRHGG